MGDNFETFTIIEIIEVSEMLVSLSIISMILVVAIAEHSSISWKITAATKSGKQLLQNVFGYAKSGKIHAILGPSGSGKTTLLNALAAQIPKGSLKLSGSVAVSMEFDPIFIQQEDILFSQLTSKETLDTSYDLRKEDSNAAKDTTVSNLLNSLGLKKVANTQVGDKKTKGISGGEKKRLHIGNEIVDSDMESNFLFADEPTSGLDCFQAERVVQLLRNIAEKGSTVIFSIHQPRASIFELFQDITLLSEGRVVYSGSKDDMTIYFADLGYSCPSNVSPAEYYVDLVSVDYSTPEEEQRTKDRTHMLADKFADRKVVDYLEHRVREEDRIHKGKKPVVPTRQHRGTFHSLALRMSALLRGINRSLQKFGILYGRAWKQVTRDKPLNIARFASSVFSALLFGVIYFKLGKESSTAADRLGLLQVAAVNCAMTSLIKATTSFVTEKMVIKKERQRGSYGVIPYFMAKMLAEIPLSSFFPCLFGVIIYNMCGLNNAPGKLLSFISILVMEAIASTSFGMSVGSLVPTAESGIAIAPAVMVIFIVFGGLYVVNVPSYLKWMPLVSKIYHRVLVHTEYFPMQSLFYVVFFELVCC
ncbi:ATP-binding cassette domain-containing protein [archaeon]|nr:MAG: ATP-binding cassette domain-containing protein [archaeon]